MNKNTILKIAPNVLKRMEYGIDICYLLNLETDELWTGNLESYLIIRELDGTKTIDEIIQKLQPFFYDYMYDDLLVSIIEFLKELLEKNYIQIIY